MTMTIPQNRRNILEFFGQARDENEARVTHEGRKRANSLRLFELGYFPPSVFHLTKLNSNIQPNVSINFLKTLKAPELFRRTYFQIKVIKSGMISDLRESLRGVFAATAHHDVGARFSCYFHILFTSRT